MPAPAPAPAPSIAPINLKPLALPGTSTPTAQVSTQKQPPGREGVAFSLAQVARMVAESQGDPLVVAFARRAVRDAGRPEKPLGKAKAIFDAMKKQKIEWVLDPIRREFMAKARYFMPSAEGKDDALLTLGDCDELVIVFLTLFLSALESVGVETGAVLGHSYSPNKMLSHVLAAVHDGRQWVRVDPSIDGEFGQFKQPTWETMISVPSCKVICNGPLCASGPRAPQPHRPDPGMEFVSLEGLDHEDARNAPLMDSFQPTEDFFSLVGPKGRVFTRGEAMASSLGALGDPASSQENPDVFSGAQVQAVADVMTADVNSVATGRDDLLTSYGRMTHFMETFGLDPAVYGWTKDLDDQVDHVINVSNLFLRATDDALAGRRRVALGSAEEGYLIELLPTDPQKIIAEGNSIFVVDALQTSSAVAHGSVGAHPAVIVVALVSGAIAVAAVASWLTEREKTLQIQIRATQSQAEYAMMYACAEKKDPVICEKLHATVGNIQTAQAQSEADKAKADAARAQAEADKAKWNLGTVGVVSVLALLLGAGGVVIAKKNGLL